MGNVVQLKDVTQPDKDDLFCMLGYINEVITKGIELRDLIDNAPLALKVFFEKEDAEEEDTIYYMIKKFGEEITQFLSDMPF